MAEHSSIEWTDATWNPITGCSVVSPGCTNCYAMKLAGGRLQHHPTRAGLTQATKAGPVWTGEVRLNKGMLLHPLRWQRPRMIFVCAHGDLFHESVSDAWIDQVFAVMALAPRHTFQVLTKRATRMRTYLTQPGSVQRIIHEAFKIDCEAGAWLSADHEIAGDPTLPLANVWLGVSVEDQPRADERIQELLATPAAVRWISAEPLLGPSDLTRVAYGQGDNGPNLRTWYNALTGDAWAEEVDADGAPIAGTAAAGGREFERGLDWVVAGGESGPGARPMHPRWAKSLRDQCAVAGVPFLFKQWGSWKPVCDTAPGESDELYHAPPARDPEAIRRCKVAELVLNADGRRPTLGGPDYYFAGCDSMLMFEVGKKAAGRLLDGVEHNAMPEPR